MRNCFRLTSFQIGRRETISVYSVYYLLLSKCNVFRKENPRYCSFDFFLSLKKCLLLQLALEQLYSYVSVDALEKSPSHFYCGIVHTRPHFVLVPHSLAIQPFLERFRVEEKTF